MDQRKLFTAATEWLPKLGYRKVRILDPRAVRSIHNLN